MPPSQGGRRQYSEDEIAQLMKRASELQNLDEGQHGAGLSLEEVEQIARETGIDPTYVRAAAADLLRIPLPKRKGFHFLGGPIFLEAERTVDGPLTDEVWAAIADELSRTYRTSGRSQAIGTGREWTYGGSRSLREVRVSATPVRGKTRIRITEEYGREAFLTFFLPLYASGVVGGLVLGQGLALGPQGVIPGIIATVATLFFGLRMYFSGRTRRRERTHQELLARIEGMVESADPVTARIEASVERMRGTPELEGPEATRLSVRPAARIEMPEESESADDSEANERLRVR